MGKAKPNPVALDHSQFIAREATNWQELVENPRYLVVEISWRREEEKYAVPNIRE